MESLGTTQAKHIWPLVRLGDVCDFVYGFPFDSNSFNDEGVGKALIRIRDVVPGKTNTFTTEVAPSKYNVSDGDLLVGMDGDFNLAQWSGGPALLNQRVCMFKPKPEALSVGFLNHSLGKYLKAIWDKKPFATVKHLSAKDLNAIFLPLPSLSIQREIVARLENELAEADSLAANFKQIGELADAEFKAELEETFERVEGEKVRLGNLGRVAMCKRVLKNQTSETGDIPFFKIGTFGKKADAFISQELFDDFSSHYSYPSKGDILISAAGTLGRTVVFDGTPSYYQDSNIVWLKHDGSRLLNPYLQYFYRTKPWEVSVGVTIPRIYNGDIERTEIPLPPLSTQCAIVAKLDAAKAHCDKLTAAAERGLRGAEKLRAAILTEAFEPWTKN